MGVHVKLWERSCGAGRDEATREPSGAAPVRPESRGRRALTVREVSAAHKARRDTSVIFFSAPDAGRCAMHTGPAQRPPGRPTGPAPHAHRLVRRTVTSRTGS